MKAVTKMTLTCLLSLGLFTAGVAGNAAGGKEKESTAQKIQSAISLPKEFKTPGFSEKVKIFFTVDESGNVVQDVAATKNPVLRQSIEKQFKQIRFSELVPQIAYNIEINFIVQ